MSKVLKVNTCKLLTFLNIALITYIGNSLKIGSDLVSQINQVLSSHTCYLELLKCCASSAITVHTRKVIFCINGSCQHRCRDVLEDEIYTVTGQCVLHRHEFVVKGHGLGSCCLPASLKQKSVRNSNLKTGVVPASETFVCVRHTSNNVKHNCSV
jgi:hypothetical protein